MSSRRRPSLFPPNFFLLFLTFLLFFFFFFVAQCHEEIAWSSDPETLKVTQAFREGTIHQHIYQQVRNELLSFFLLLDFVPELKLIYLRFLFEQDGKTLDFLYYFDYLRAYPHVYSEMTKPYGPPGGK